MAVVQCWLPENEAQYGDSVRRPQRPQDPYIQPLRLFHSATPLGRAPKNDHGQPPLDGHDASATVPYTP